MDEGQIYSYNTSSAGRRGEGGTSIHITALDGIMNVKSLFTLAVFLGLAWNPYDPGDGGVAIGDCAAGPRVLEDLVSFHVFSSLLSRSLVSLRSVSSKPSVSSAHLPGHGWPASTAPYSEPASWPPLSDRCWAAASS
ncbi:hypothetical protein HPP92_020870 [Vanilla planifolia]|uniref:Uncharacterized protein n=1 Tax=Vanilla planifolia TaxID=51239 RepID=A0A835PYV2_VANPL|nr:hypothetical protein HPP92_020870 [Vanilla planifolia]